MDAAGDSKRKRDPQDEGANGSDSDSNDASGDEASGLGKAGKSLSKADKRAHHNALERKRRDHIKDSFSVLRDSIPALSGEKQASRAQILNKATDYIQFMRKKNMGHQSELEDLKKQNAQLVAQGESLEQAGAPAFS